MKIEYYTDKNGQIWFWLGIGIYLLFTLCFGISGYFFESSYIFPIAWILLGGYGIFYFALKLYYICLSDNEIKYKTLCGKIKVFDIAQISFTEEYELQEDKRTILTPNQRREQKLVLYIHFSKYRVKLYQDSEPQYNEILFYCKQKLRRVNEPDKKYQYFMPLWILIGMIIAHFISIMYCSSQKIEGFVKIRGVYVSHSFSSSGKGKRIYHLDIKLKGYDNLTFGDWSMYREYKDKVDNILNSKPHTFTFTISRDDYEKKIKKSVPMEFCDKYMGRNFVEVSDKLENITDKNGQIIFLLDD